MLLLGYYLKISEKYLLSKTPLTDPYMHIDHTLERKWIILNLLVNKNTEHSLNIFQ